MFFLAMHRKDVDTLFLKKYMVQALYNDMEEMQPKAMTSEVRLLSQTQLTNARAPEVSPSYPCLQQVHLLKLMTTYKHTYAD